ncbi:hypothetical protein GETHOR_05050 [Geothrix oryzae]|uniref:Defect at low temperature protein 1 n=1 Tax=Geothrix oryzae TaxID=2927975 RepID=A0ABM8DNG7_9BACT|nr:hypothetical protein [Geothrix oryzae]BDU68404.1 hypothetical protein GETHOR_05050 [Geothrix oryzae]
MINKERALLLGFIASSFLILLKVWLPASTSISYRLLDSLYWLAVSFVPGYFIYLLVAYLPIKRDRRLLAPFIASQSSQICVRALFLLRDISNETGIPLSMQSSKEEIDQAWSKIDRERPGPAIKRTNPITPCTWMEVIYDYRSRSVQAVDALLCYVPYLEADHLRILTDIRNCYFFTCVQNAITSDISPNNCGIPGSSLYEFVALSLRLNAYLEKAMKGVQYVKLSDYKHA